MTPTDPLEQLRDIHAPSVVSAWPPGPGWWLLAGAALLITSVTGWWLWRRYQRNAWRRQAILELQEARKHWLDSGEDDTFLYRLSEILKRAAMQRGTSGNTAGLHGDAWNQFLDAQWRRPPARGFTAIGFAQQIYRPAPAEPAIDELHHLGELWLREFSC
jgi:ABC-type nickel/cobalt efflux system permease component RcnA